MATVACVRATSPRTPSTPTSPWSRAYPRGVPGLPRRRASRATTIAATPSEYDDALLAAELESLIEDTRVAGGDAHTHIVAFSGGVDSSLCAYLVHRAFGGDLRRDKFHATKTTADDGVRTRTRAYAAVGVSPSLPSSQLETARRVAKSIGIPLREVFTDEGAEPAYVANEGESCLHCKNELYATLRAVALDARGVADRFPKAPERRPKTPSVAASDDTSFRVYNGTNFDDRADETRLGLVSATAHGVVSPLFDTPKTRVRELARVAGLPNWNLAAAPCLRSRLAFGVPALARTLADVDAAEKAVRAILRVQPEENMRVRVLSGTARATRQQTSVGSSRPFSFAGEAEEKRVKASAAGSASGSVPGKGKPAALELDPHNVRVVEADPGLRESLREALARCGFEVVEMRAFASGSVARLPPRRKEEA